MLSRKWVMKMPSDVEKIAINNLYDYAFGHKFVVAFLVEEDTIKEYWFDTAWDDFRDALHAAEARQGQVFPVEYVRRGER